MENISKDIGGEIIFKLKELNKILEQIFEKLKDGKKLTSPYCARK